MDFPPATGPVAGPPTANFGYSASLPRWTGWRKCPRLLFFLSSKPCQSEGGVRNQQHQLPGTAVITDKLLLHYLPVHPQITLNVAMRGTSKRKSGITPATRVAPTSSWAVYFAKRLPFESLHDISVRQLHMLFVCGVGTQVFDAFMMKVFSGRRFSFTRGSYALPTLECTIKCASPGMRDLAH